MDVRAVVRIVLEHVNKKWEVLLGKHSKLNWNEYLKVYSISYLNG